MRQGTFTCKNAPRVVSFYGWCIQGSQRAAPSKISLGRREYNHAWLWSAWLRKSVMASANDGSANTVIHGTIGRPDVAAAPNLCMAQRAAQRGHLQRARPDIEHEHNA